MLYVSVFCERMLNVHDYATRFISSALRKFKLDMFSCLNRAINHKIIHSNFFFPARHCICS